MKLLAVNGILYLALAAWMVCTYFCTVDGYDDLPAVHDSLCRPHVIVAQAEREGRVRQAHADAR